MRKRMGRKALFIFPALVLASVFGAAARGGPEAEEPEVSGAGRKLVFPALVWTRPLPEEITCVDMAEKTGQVVASTSHKVYSFSTGPGADWTFGGGKGIKHIDDLAINRQGTRIMFQSDTKKKRATQSMDLTIHMLDKEGNELWKKKNPYRYQDAVLSPSGKYIVIGELMAASTKLFDDNLNLLWTKPVQFWYVAFDPGERFLFDGEGGILYTLPDGKSAWDFGRYTRILSVSDDAEYVMTSYYRAPGSSERMFLMARKALKKIELSGKGGCVSPDGAYMAYVSSDNKLLVYRTKEVLTSGVKDLPPLFEAKMIKPWAMNLARDNRTLFVMGKDSSITSAMMLVDLEKMKKAWEKPVANSLRTALTTEDNREVLVKYGPKMLKMYKSY